MKEELNALVKKYNDSSLSVEEMKLLESYIEQGLVNLDDLSGLVNMQSRLDNIQDPEPSESMSTGFYEKLVAQKPNNNSVSIIKWLTNLWTDKPAYQWAYTLILLAVGLLLGYFLQPISSSSQEIKNLSAEVTEMKEMMMLSLLEEESTSDRLKAVNLTSELPDASKKVTTALIKTLNNDENVNVRLATIEALYPYASDPKVRQGLIQSIAKQESPLVQIALAEMMVALQEKSSVNELEQILEKEETPEEIKDRIKESIKVLI